MSHLGTVEERLHHIRELVTVQFGDASLGHLELGLHEREALRQLGHLRAAQVLSQRQSNVNHRGVTFRRQINQPIHQ